MTEPNKTEQGEKFFKAEAIAKDFYTPAPLKILNAVNLELAKGEMVSIVGASGTGKTTLLHILGGLDRPTAGHLFCNGENVFAKNDHELSRFRNKVVGFVFQFHHLLPEFSAIENVMLPGLIAEHNREHLKKEAMNLLDRVGVAQRADHKVGELSGGEQQRVALARALIQHPMLLLADEPTGNLDPKTGIRVFELLQELNSTLNLTTVIVTHNHDLARRMDRNLTLAEGKLHE